jgi:hypothetical protein
MPGGSTAQRGNELFAQMLYLPLVTVPNLPASSTVAQTFAVAGTQLGDLISWNMQTNIAGAAVENIFVSAAGVLTFIWSNATIAAINGTAPQPFIIEVTRSENAVDGGIATLPTSVF